MTRGMLQNHAQEGSSASSWNTPIEAIWGGHATTTNPDNMVKDLRQEHKEGEKNWFSKMMDVMVCCEMQKSYGVSEENDSAVSTYKV